MRTIRICSTVALLCLALPACSFILDFEDDGRFDSKSNADAGGRSGAAGAGAMTRPGGVTSTTIGDSAPAGLGSTAGESSIPVISASPQGGAFTTTVAQTEVGGTTSGSGIVGPGTTTQPTAGATGIVPAQSGGTNGGGTSGVAGAIGIAGTNGTTAPECDASTKRCNDTCVDTSTDKANCGDCGHACEGYQFCEGGRCLPTYVSTTVLEGEAILTAAHVSADKLDGDLFLQLYAGSAGIAVHAPTAPMSTISNDIVIAKFTGEVTYLWRRTMKGLFGQYVSLATVNAMSLGSNGDLYVGYEHHGPSNPGGTPITLHMARVSGSNNPSVVWDAEVNDPIPQLMLPRSARGDIITIGEPPDVIGRWTSSSVCRLVDQVTTASYSCLSPSYASGAAVSQDGSTLWMWGRYDGTWALNPWSTQTWTVPANPSLGANAYAWPDTYVIGARDDGTSLGAWMTEGDAGPALNLASDSTGHLIMTVTSSMPNTFNGGQALIGDTTSALVRVNPSTGQIVWRTPLNAKPTRVFVGTTDRIIVLYEATNGAPFTLSIHSNVTGKLLSTISAGSMSFAQPVFALGQRNFYVLGEVTTAGDYDPGAAVDVHGETAGVFISRYSF